MGSDMHRTTMGGHALRHVHATAGVRSRGPLHSRGAHIVVTRSCWTHLHQPWRAGSKSGKRGAACPMAAAPTAHIAHVPGGPTHRPGNTCPNPAKQASATTGVGAALLGTQCTMRPTKGQDVNTAAGACLQLYPSRTQHAGMQPSWPASEVCLLPALVPSPQCTVLAHTRHQQPRTVPARATTQPCCAAAAIAARDSRCTQTWTGAVLACPGTNAAPIVALHRCCRLCIVYPGSGAWL